MGGAIIAMAADLRLATPERNARFCSRGWGLRAAIWALGRAAADHRAGSGGGTAIYGRVMTAQRGRTLGVLERFARRGCVGSEALVLARRLAAGPCFAMA